MKPVDILSNKGVVIPKGLLLREEIGANGYPVISFVSSGSVIVRNDEFTGQVYIYGALPKPGKKTRKGERRLSKRPQQIT